MVGSVGRFAECLHRLVLVEEGGTAGGWVRMGRVVAFRGQPVHARASRGDIVAFTLAEGDEDRTVKALTELHETTGFPAADVMGKIGSLLCP